MKLWWWVWHVQSKSVGPLTGDRFLTSPTRPGKLWSKMRRMSIISSVLHIFVSSLRLKHRMSLIQHVLDSPGLVDYFSYPHHGWKVRKKDLGAIWKQKLASKMRKVRNVEMVRSAWKLDFSTANFFSKVSKIFPIGHIAFIFSFRRVFIVILDPWTIWRAYDKTSGKYLGKA